jgi:hypothetical protein
VLLLTRLPPVSEMLELPSAATPPPSELAVLLLTRLPSAMTTLALPSTTNPPPSYCAVFPRTLLLVICTFASPYTHIPPPELSTMLLDTLLVLKTTLAWSPTISGLTWLSAKVLLCTSSLLLCTTHTRFFKGTPSTLDTLLFRKMILPLQSVMRQRDASVAFELQLSVSLTPMNLSWNPPKCIELRKTLALVGPLQLMPAC